MMIIVKVKAANACCATGLQRFCRLADQEKIKDPPRRHEGHDDTKKGFAAFRVVFSLPSVPLYFVIFMPLW
jgi:hypothetical protein